MEPVVRTPRPALAVAAAVLAAALSGCGLFGEEQAETDSVAVDDDAPVTPSPEEQDVTDDADGSDVAAGEGTEEATNEDADFDVDLPPAQDLDLEQRHPNGVTVRLARVSFEPSAVLVDLDIVNGFDRELTLAATGGGTPEPVELEDDVGTTYAFDPPEGNPDLALAPGESLEGTLVFSGRFPADATSLTLAFLRPGNQDNPRATRPEIVFEDVGIERDDVDDADS